MTPTRASTFSLSALGALSGALYLADIPATSGVISALLKAVPVLCLAAWVSLSGPQPRGWLVVAGLLASAAGDILLDLGVPTFLPGVGAFALAHLLYIAAFTFPDPRLRPLTAVPCIIWGALVLWRIMPGLGPEAAPVTAYVLIITAMMWRAAAQAAGPAHRWAWLGLAGAVLFGASDTLIALGRWGELVTGGWLVMLLYWGGQACIAAWGTAGHGDAGTP